MGTELRDVAERVGRLERLSTRITRYGGQTSDLIVPVENVSGANLEHGATVVLTGIGAADGVLEVGKPDTDSDMQFLGLIVGKLLAGAIGRCQIAGIAEARRDTTAMGGAAPVIGSHIGPQEDSHELAHDQFGARFLVDLHDAGGNVKICLVSLQRTERLVADHRTNPNHLESTAVYSPYDVGGNTSWINGQISDVWAVHAATSGKDAYSRVMWDIRRGAAGHDHGWMLGYVIEEGGTGTTESWGPLTDVLGMREPGQSHVDVKTLAQFNDGSSSMPVLFNPTIEPVLLDGTWAVGAMVRHPDGVHWVPSVPVSLELRTITLGQYYDNLDDCGESDHCRLLVDPTRYKKAGGMGITGPHDPSNSFCNYLEHIACNRHDINGIFDALWYVSCCFSFKVGEMDSNLQGFAASGQSLDTYLQQVNALLAALSAFHPTTAGLMTAVTNAYSTMVWYATNHCGKGPCGAEGVDLPYLLTCPYWGQQT